MSENRKSMPCANGCHSATDAHVFMDISTAKPSDSSYELPAMPTMQECDGTCGDIYSSDELTKFPCLHALCGMCLNECSLVERDGKFLCPMRECKYLSSKTLHMQQSTVTATDSNSDEKRKNPTEASYDPSSSSTEAVSKLRASKLSESESDEEHINND